MEEVEGISKKHQGREKKKKASEYVFVIYFSVKHFLKSCLAVYQHHKTNRKKHANLTEKAFPLTVFHYSLDYWPMGSVLYMPT